MYGKSLKPVKWHVSQEADQAITKAYQTTVGFSRRPVVKELGERFGVPRWKISRRASHLGLIPKHKKQPPWTDKELALLEYYAHFSPAVIQRHLKKRGFNRSETGIVVKRKRSGFLSRLHGYSLRAVARGFGIDGHTINRWIQSGKLKAVKRGTTHQDTRHGDIYYIEPDWIRAFILEYLDLIDIRKVDKYWFIEILVGKNGKENKERSPCLGCYWQHMDKDICMPGCEKIDQYQRSQPRTLLVNDDDNEQYEIGLAGPRL